MAIKKRTKTKLKEEIKELNRNIEFQSDIIRRFGDELLYFQRQKGNVLFEVKLKKYKDEILELKKGLMKDNRKKDNDSSIECPTCHKPYNKNEDD